MSDIAALVKARLVAEVSAFDAIGIAANLGSAIAASSILPAAYVIRAGRSAEENTLGTGGHSQRITESFSVLIVDRVSGGVSGEATSLAVEALCDEIQSALIGWSPDAPRDPVNYVGGALVDWTEPALMIWIEDFMTVRYARTLQR